MSKTIQTLLILLFFCASQFVFGKAKEEADPKQKSIKTRPVANMIGLQAGMPFIHGDIPNTSGFALGASFRRSLGYVVSFRMSYDYMANKGLDYQKQLPNNLGNNEMFNGKLYPNLNYAGSNEPLIANFKTTSHKIELSAIFNLNNVNFEFKEVKWNYYGSVNLGLLMYQSFTNQLKDNQIYNYDTIFDVTQGKSKSEVKTRLKEWLDDSYETEAKALPPLSKLMNKNVTPFVGVGVGVEYKLTDNIQIGLEANYNLSGSNYLDGQGYSRTGAVNILPDRFSVVMLRIGYKLGKDDSKYWFKNPLSLQENNNNKGGKKNHNQIVQNIYGNQMDSIYQMLNILRADSDSDGVSDFFDKEPNTAKNSIVDGAGRAIFLRDADNNPVFNDPMFNSTSSIYDPEGTSYSLDEKGQKKKEYPDGRIYQKAPDGSTIQTTPDGKQYAKTNDGKTYLINPEGSKQEVEFSEPNEGEAVITVDKLGNTIKTYPSGLRYKQTKDGTIFKTYPDGTTYKKSKDGRIYIVGTDITDPLEVEFDETDPQGTKYYSDEEGTRYKQYPNGIKYKITEDGTVFKTYPDGSTYMKTQSGKAIKILTDNEKKETELDFRDPSPKIKPNKPAPVISQQNNKAGNTTINNSSNSLVNSLTNQGTDYLPAVFFESNKSEVEPKYFPEIFMIADMMKKNPALSLRIIGYCDSRADDEYNKKLGLDRARTVAYVLSNYFGVSESRLDIQTQGRDNRLVKNDETNPNAMAANRRVQFEIISKENPQQKNKSTLYDEPKNITPKTFEKKDDK